MTVETNDAIAIAIASLRRWLANKLHASFSTNEKQNQNHSHLVRAFFPALWVVSYR